MTMSKAPSLYNQDMLDDAEFVDQFVARQVPFEKLVRSLEITPAEAAGTHFLLIGARGMGKTSLLRRLAIAISSDADLAARFVPLRFREEQYNILRPGDFWRNCGDSLAQWADDRGDHALAHRLDEAVAGPGWADDDGAARSFAEEMRCLDRRAVLLVDNLDLVINDNWSRDTRWRLREALQARRGPILIGAATQPLKESADREAAFYEFFHPVYLEPLDEAETAACMRALAARRGEAGQPVLDILATQPARIRTLHRLTGGNPRILAFLYRLLERGETDAAMADLEALLDQVTPYYKARIEEYQTQHQRAVIDAIGLHWDPITLADLAATTRIPTTSLPSILQKLKNDGLIETVETSGAYAGHQLVERFLNIWYLMRHGTRRTRLKLRWLVAFLTSFYSPDELSSLANGLPGAAREGSFAIALKDALALVRGRKNSKAGADIPINYEELELMNKKLQDFHDLNENFRLYHDLMSQKRYNDALIHVEKQIDTIKNYDDEFEDSTKLGTFFMKGLVFIALNRMAEAAEVFAQVARVASTFEDEASREWGALAWRMTASAQLQLGDAAGTELSLNEVLERYSEDPSGKVQTVAARAAVELAGLHITNGAPEQALAALKALISRFTTGGYHGELEPIIMAYLGIGKFHTEQGQIPKALEAYASMMPLAVPGSVTNIARPLAVSLWNFLYQHFQLGNVAESEDIYRKMSELLGDSNDREVLSEIFYSQIFLGVMELDKGDYSFSRKLFQKSIDYYVKNPDENLHAGARLAQERQIGLLWRAGALDEALALVRQGQAWRDDWNTQLDETALNACRFTVANLLIDVEADLLLAEDLLGQVRAGSPAIAHRSLFWLYSLQGRLEEAKAQFQTLLEEDRHLKPTLEAALELQQHNRGRAMELLAMALEQSNPELNPGTLRELERLLRLAARLGEGEAVLAWLESSGWADKLAPVHAAFRALLRGETTLRDVNPEVREPATIIFRRLSGVTPPPAPPRQSRGRGRPRKA